MKELVGSMISGTEQNLIFRYRNFRTFTSPRPAQFACVAMDSTGEFVAAGGHDVFEIYLWSIKMGRLLEVLSSCWLFSVDLQLASVLVHGSVLSQCGTLRTGLQQDQIVF
jgi:hypothetical protein